jgi:two-component system OmpR family sensor kinase
VRGLLASDASGWRGLLRWDSLRTRLIFWNVLTLSVLIGILGLVARSIVLRSLMASVDRELDIRTTPMGPAAPRPPGDGQGPRRTSPNSPQPEDRQEGRPQDGRPQYPRPNGRQEPNFRPGENRPREGGQDKDPRQNGDPDQEGRSGGGFPQDQDARFNGGQNPQPRGNDPQGSPLPQQGNGNRFRPLRLDINNPYRPVHFDKKGIVTEISNYRTPLDPKGFQEALQGHIYRNIVTVDGEPMRVLSRPLPKEGPPNGVVQAPYPLTEMYVAIDGLDHALLLLAPFGLLGAGLAGAFLTDQVLRRVRRLTQAAGRISAQEFSERLPASGNDEFSELAHTFNSMLGRLQTAFQKQERLIEQQRRFTADASHELKTPLTIVKGNSGFLLSSARTDEASKPALQEIDQAADTMSRLVQDLLLLARSDDGQLGGNPIELLVSEVLQRAAGRIGSRPAAVIRYSLPPDLTVYGNEQELLRLFTNLIANAVNYTPVEGQILITAVQDGPNVRITVADNGIGIAPEHLPHLGERFYRVDSARTRSEGGTGLGLSICRSIVQAHHGSLTIQSQVGAGTVVTVTLPSAV